jgi:WD40 repeat protein
VTAPRFTTALQHGPDGNRVVVGFSGDMVGVWDAAAGGAPLRTLRGFGGEVAALAFSPDGKRLATAGDRYVVSGDRGAVVLWDFETGQELLDQTRLAHSSGTEHGDQPASRGLDRILERLHEQCQRSPRGR